MNSVYVTYNNRTYAVDIDTGEVEARVEIKNPDQGNLRCKWVKTTGIHIRKILLSMACNKVAA